MHWECSTPTPASRTAPSILLVTKDKSAYDLVRQALGEGYACLCAVGRQAAETVLRKQPIGLILLDHAEEHPRFLRY
ncbi:hypothetical protein GF373_17165, partial [bacterium]|nr:hypothetical protein [bacterium]